MDVVTARALLEANPDTLVVDVRTPAEFETAHIAGAINLPLDQVDDHLQQIVTDAGGQLVLVCHSGSRADQACRKLTEAGHGGAEVMAGGMASWVAAGAPVVRGKPRWALERQVRLVAGGIVLAAIVASVWLPPLRYLAGLVGAGLVVAALTNTCAMGALLAKLPYNRRGGDGGSAATQLRARTRAGDDSRTSDR
ncbi:rhodanese-like domain-containing protein [Natronosporangium hydrolyticum]|uniref:Rhodanese-like domain-containing protein n=1 Tax=Natronosporangium hydrolyticum TaxID=2811111 RepID=A0A895YA76_9ACTN|nr:rhodanese-like domain-containing protein [Natronosporangium hydrolyticum]QSB13205.1 rhodanese-like domain-containing protein [Natronosporangium hydrolyticum]